jgi:hypothetical protein
LENKLSNNRIRWYGHILRMKEERMTKKVLSMKVKGECPRGRLSLRWENQVRKICHIEGRNSMGRNRGGVAGRQMNGEAWLSEDPHKVEMS